MKKIILLLLFAFKMNAQVVPPFEPIRTETPIPMQDSVKGWHGYSVLTYSVGQPTRESKWDTVRTAFLITDWDDDILPHKAYVVNGWTVRTRNTYFGEPQSSWTVRKFLDYHRKPFGSGVIIWQYKINYSRKDTY